MNRGETPIRRAIAIAWRTTCWQIKGFREADHPDDLTASTDICRNTGETAEPIASGRNASVQAAQKNGRLPAGSFGGLLIRGAVMHDLIVFGAFDNQISGQAAFRTR
jgi:ribosomal protein L34E